MADNIAVTVTNQNFTAIVASDAVNSIVIDENLNALVQDSGYTAVVQDINYTAAITNQDLNVSYAFPGPQATSVPRLTQTFDTDLGTNVGDLVKVNGTNSVTRIVDNTAVEIPNGIFGVGFNKPSSLRLEVMFIGIGGGYSGFTAGLPIFVSTLGVPTHTVATTGMVQQIGFAISSTEFFLNIMQAIRRS